MNLHSIETGLFKLDGGAMFGVVPKVLWQKTNPADDNNLCTWASRCLLIEDNNRLILIDCGIGDKQDEKFLGRYHLHGEHTLDKSLQKIGFRKDDITDVILTHLHFDHCGGAVMRENGNLIPAFKNAKYWSNELHWEWATLPNDREKASFLNENILPLQKSGQLHFIPIIEEFEFTTNIKIKFAYGHTHAMMLPKINFKGKTLVFVSDLIPSASHIPLPYLPAYDMFPLKTLEEKKIFLNEAVNNGYLLFFQHDAKIECCTLERTEKGVVVSNTLKLQDI